MYKHFTPWKQVIMDLTSCFLDCSAVNQDWQTLSWSGLIWTENLIMQGCSVVARLESNEVGSTVLNPAVPRTSPWAAKLPKISKLSLRPSSGHQILQSTGSNAKLSNGLSPVPRASKLFQSIPCCSLERQAVPWLEAVKQHIKSFNRRGQATQVNKLLMKKHVSFPLNY
jgi:hypothetical protein